jgi:hypothetical protein
MVWNVPRYPNDVARRRSAQRDSRLICRENSGGALAEGSVKDLLGTYPTHFAGLPPEGVHASTPMTGKLVLSFYPGLAWNVYADGRMIWQKWTHSGDPVVIPQGARMIDTSYVQQRLTLREVKLLRSTILATGLFQHNLTLNIGRQHAGFSLGFGEAITWCRLTGCCPERTPERQTPDESNTGPGPRPRATRAAPGRSGRMASDHGVGRPRSPSLRAISLLRRDRSKRA